MMHLQSGHSNIFHSVSSRTSSIQTTSGSFLTGGVITGYGSCGVSGDLGSYTILSVLTNGGVNTSSSSPQCSVGF